MSYISIHVEAEVLRHAIHQAECARDMARKLPRADDLVADLTSVIDRMQARVEPIWALLKEREEA